MTTMLRGTLRAILLGSLLIADTPAQPPAEKFKLEGRVVTTSGGPVRRATVVLGGRNLQLAAESDDDGRFSFADVEPGQMTVQVVRNGYLDATYPTITTGAQPRPITIVMTRESIIRGTVTDEYGDPFPNLAITVGVRSYSKGGWQMSRISGITLLSLTTGPDGAYVLGGLPAGKYYVSAELSIARSAFSLMAATSQGPQRAYIPTFHPSATELSLATAVAVAAETEVRGVDIRMRRVNVFRVRGKHAIPEGNRAPDLRLTPLNASPSNSSGRLMFSARNLNGTFEFTGVPPGTYVLQSQGSVVSVRQIVTVSDRDVDGIVLQSSPGAKLSGTIRYASSNAPRGLPEVALTMEGESNASQTARTQADGTFEYPSLDAGAYRIGIQNRTQYIQSLLFNGQRVQRRRIEVESGASSTLAVVVGTDVAEVTGIVRDDRGQPVPKVRVTIWEPGGFPADANSSYAITENDGSIRFFGLPPGDYRIAAWEQVESGLPEAPEFLKQFDAQATSVTLGSNAKEKLEAIKLIRREAIETATAKMP
jgi:protocatechuate 3,4-dioxygenase beta subunit